MSKASRGEMSFLQHLEVLRWHLIRSSVAIILMAGLCFVGKGILFDQIIFGPKDPNFITYRMICSLTKNLGTEGVLCIDEMPFRIINNKMAGQFSTHIWVSLVAGFILAFPYVLFELWRFVKPGLKGTERRYSRGVIFFASLLFLMGVSFGYYLIAPLSVQFLGGYSISGQIDNLIDLLSYISTVTTVTLSSGLIFELPIIVYFLAKIGLITPDWMRTYRRHALVLILILSAVITPPDITSQVLVAVPILVLYEISIKICARVVRKQNLENTELAER